LIACFYFTEDGEKIAFKIRGHFQDVKIYKKENYKENLKAVFENFDKIIFISAAGIAVRLIAPYIRDKWNDPAVVVVDDMGRYVISLLSGHFGGANEFAVKVAEVLNAIPVITTASDSRGFESIDLFAKKRNFVIENPEDVKVITSLMLQKRKIAVFSDIGPVEINYPCLTREGEGFIYITCKDKFDKKYPSCVLRPKVLNVGIGCKRGTYKKQIEEAINRVFLENNLSVKCIKIMATVDLKRDERGLIEFAEEKNIPLRFFSRDEIMKVQERFRKSEFVYKSLGVYSVAEPCAFLLSPEIIVRKTAVNGVTLSVSREVFDV